MPKIIIERIPPRTSVCEPQLAEQLVEMPAILYFLKQPIAEQIVDIPVLGLQGSLAGESSTAPTVAQIVDNPAPGARTEFILIFALSSWFG